MDILDRLNEINEHIRIYPASDKRFNSYGMIHKADGMDAVIDFLKGNAVAEERQVYYEMSVEGLERQNKFNEYIKKTIYGEMDLQLGWCYGWCTRLGGLEYHKGSEVIAAATDIVLLLGHRRDIELKGKPVYDLSKVEAFLVKEGALVELYANTLHCTPLQVKTSQQFTTAIALPKGTNGALSFRCEADGENVMRAAVNKWMISHPESGQGYIGITGDNIEIKTV